MTYLDEKTEEIKFSRIWAMPNSRTFQIPPIRDFITRYLEEFDGGRIVDPFANESTLATITNDLDTQYDTTFHMDATDFLKIFDSESVDVVLYDPPYSSRQVSECYKKLGKSVNMETTQGSYWSKQKREIARILKPGGICISLGWNSNGIGKKLGFKPIEILLVQHGGAHNDTIIMCERKNQQ